MTVWFNESIQVSTETLYQEDFKVLLNI